MADGSKKVKARLQDKKKLWNVFDIEIKGDISSQYISALLMIAPTLNNGLKLKN